MIDNHTIEILEELHDRYNRVEFIETDPISIPHRFLKKEDIEIAGFFSAILAWGQRSQIIKSANWLMELMENEPYSFTMQAGKKELCRLEKFYYRTFQSVDALFFFRAVREIYLNYGGLEKVFTRAFQEEKNMENGLKKLYSLFDAVPHEGRSMKHIANIAKGASAKRLNMFLRWMIRKDNRGVDFGLWEQIPSSALFIPLDVHSGRIAREFGLLLRKQNDWKGVLELTNTLRQLDPDDPVKYDFALFGFGVNQIG